MIFLQYFYLISEDILYCFPLTYQVVLTVMNQYFSRAETRVVVARHREAIGTSIAEGDDVAFFDLRYLAVPAECICLADITHDGIYTWDACGV